MQIILLDLAAILLMASDAFAGRATTDEERTRLVAAVTAQACSGGKMEFDDGKFAIDDAVSADGKRYDLDFDTSFSLIKKKLED
jgi:hypothetical protein